MCEHVYRDLGPGPCGYCGLDTRSINWKQQNELNKQWLKDNPLAYKQVGWWSI